MKAFRCCFNEYQYFLRYIDGILIAERKPLREFLVNLTIHRTRHHGLFNVTFADPIF